MGVRVVRAERLSEEAFSPFGHIVSVGAGASPSLSGSTWRCWYPLASVPSSRPLLLGLVETGPVEGPMTLMERHEYRVEVLIALDRPIVQVVAPSEGGSPRPLAESARAFVVMPGEAIVLQPGTWHAVAAPTDGEVVRYLFGLADPDESEVEGGWTPISEAGVTVELDPADREL